MELCQNFLNSDPTNSKVRTIWAETLLGQGHTNGAAAEADPAHQLGKLRLGAQPVKHRLGVKLDQIRVAFLVRPFEPSECRVPFVARSVNLGEIVGQNVVLPLARLEQVASWSERQPPTAYV